MRRCGAPAFADAQPMKMHPHAKTESSCALDRYRGRAMSGHMAAIAAGLKAEQAIQHRRMLHRPGRRERRPGGAGPRRARAHAAVDRHSRRHRHDEDAGQARGPRRQECRPQTGEQPRPASPGCAIWRRCRPTAWPPCRRRQRPATSAASAGACRRGLKPAMHSALDAHAWTRPLRGAVASSTSTSRLPTARGRWAPSTRSTTDAAAARWR